MLVEYLATVSIRTILGVAALVVLTAVLLNLDGPSVAERNPTPAWYQAEVDLRDQQAGEAAAEQVARIVASRATADVGNTPDATFDPGMLTQ